MFCVWIWRTTGMLFLQGHRIVFSTAKVVDRLSIQIEETSTQRRDWNALDSDLSTRIRWIGISFIHLKVLKIVGGRCSENTPIPTSELDKSTLDVGPFFTWLPLDAFPLRHSCRIHTYTPESWLISANATLTVTLTPLFRGFGLFELWGSVKLNPLWTQIRPGIHSNIWIKLNHHHYGLSENLLWDHWAAFDTLLEKPEFDSLDTVKIVMKGPGILNWVTKHREDTLREAF